MNPASNTDAMDTVTNPEMSILGSIASKIIFLSSSVFPIAFATSFEIIKVPGNPNSAVEPIAIDINISIPKNFPAIDEKILNPITPNTKQPTIGIINDNNISGVALDKFAKITVNRQIITKPWLFAEVIESLSRKPISLAITPNIKHTIKEFTVPFVNSDTLTAKKDTTANLSNKMELV